MATLQQHHPAKQRRGSLLLGCLGLGGARAVDDDRAAPSGRQQQQRQNAPSSPTRTTDSGAGEDGGPSSRRLQEGCSSEPGAAATDTFALVAKCERLEAEASWLRARLSRLEGSQGDPTAAR